MRKELLKLTIYSLLFLLLTTPFTLTAFQHLSIAVTLGFFADQLNDVNSKLK